MDLGHRARLKLEELEAICRERSLPLTVQRRVVLEVLSRRADHPSADHVFEDCRKRMPEISRTTVYRVLETLIRVGIARKVCHPGAAVRYEVETHRHHHLVCLKCQAMVDLDDASLDNLPLPSVKSGFQITDYSIQFRGLCSKCADDRTSGAGSRRKPAARSGSYSPRRPHVK